MNVIIKKGKDFDWFLLFGDTLFIGLLIVSQEYLILFFPILYCSIAIICQFILWLRWQKNPAVVLTDNYIVLNHNLLFHNEKIDLSYLQLNLDKKALFINNDGNNLSQQNSILFKHKNKKKIRFNTLSDNDQQLILKAIGEIKIKS